MMHIEVEQRSRNGRAYSYTVSRGPYILLITTSRATALGYAEQLRGVRRTVENGERKAKSI